jgi:DivIVA domain-containing protein
MTLRPDDIERQVFKEVWRGYDQDEVDRFLDRVADALGTLAKSRDELAERLRRVEAEAAEAIEAEQLLKRTLVAAQRTADETVAEARERAEQQLLDAEQRAQERLTAAEQRASDIVETAQRGADDLLATTHAQANRELAHARGEAARVRRGVEDLQRLRAEYRDRVRAVIAEHLALLDSAADVPDVPHEIAALANFSAPQPLPDDAPLAIEISDAVREDVLADWGAGEG